VLTKTLTGIVSEASVVGGEGSKLAGRSPSPRCCSARSPGGLLVLHVSVAASLGLAGALVLGIGLAVHVLSRPDAAWI
jgi:hypothetical protein